MRPCLPKNVTVRAYGDLVTHSDLALAGIACAAVPGMQPVSVQEWRRPEVNDPSPAQRALIEDATGRRWMVVVPRTPVGAAELERNDVLTRQLGKHVPFKIPVATGYAGVGAAGRAAVFPYIEGSAINFHRIPAGPGLSSAIGRALAAVHNMPAGFFDEFGVPTFDAAGHRLRRLADLDRAAETGLVPGDLLSRWETAFDTASIWRFAATPVHGSLTGWSLLVAFTEDEAATARVLAMTGWEHAAVADPAEDFANLVKQSTPAAVESIFESYMLARANRPDKSLLIRARLASEMSLLQGLATAVGADDQETVDARVDELRKLSRLSSADDPLVPGSPPVLTAVAPTIAATGATPTESAPTVAAVKDPNSVAESAPPSKPDDAEPPLAQEDSNVSASASPQVDPEGSSDEWLADQDSDSETLELSSGVQDTGSDEDATTEIPVVTAEAAEIEAEAAQVEGGPAEAEPAQVEAEPAEIEAEVPDQSQAMEAEVPDESEASDDWPHAENDSDRAAAHDADLGDGDTTGIIETVSWPPEETAEVASDLATDADSDLPDDADPDSVEMDEETRLQDLYEAPVSDTNSPDEPPSNR